MIKRLNLAVILLAFFFVFVPVTKAAEECDQYQCNSGDEDNVYLQCLNDKKSCIEGKLDEIESEKNTLKGALGVINGNINIQEIQIQHTVGEINKLEKEIESLDERISGLSISLDRLTTLLVDRIRTQYKQKRANPFTNLIASKSFSNFISQYRYLSIAGKQTAETMQKAQYQRVYYDEQKDVKQEKQDEIEVKRRQLQAEQNNLLSQRKSKNDLLVATENDEQKFQELLRQAEAQLASFSRFVDFQGGATILGNQTVCDGWGCYYNQRDSQWGNQFIGNSNSTMAEYGCLVTSMAMIASHNGKSLTPAQIASSSNPFWYNTAYMNQGTWSVNGVSMTRTRIGYNSSKIDSELSAGRPVVVGIGAGPDHFLVIRSKENGQYIMRDPFTANGKDIPFTDKYSLSSISTVDRVTVN